MRAPTPAQAAAIRLAMRLKPDRVHELRPRPAGEKIAKNGRRGRKPHKSQWS